MKNDGLLKPERTMDFIDRTAWVCQCGHECCEPGYTFGPAVRDHFLFHFAVHGRGVLHNEYGDFPVEPGQGFFYFSGRNDGLCSRPAGSVGILLDRFQRR